VTDGRPACPYAGPRSFRTGERLHGRDRESVELLDLLIAQRIVLLVAPSGAGKTSLVQAGLVPRLIEEGFDVVGPARVSLQEVSASELDGGNRYAASLVLSLEREGATAAATPEETAGRAGFVDYLDRLRDARGSASQVLLLDQFEEILTADPLDHAGRMEFFGLLGAALRSPDRWALVSMREDHLAGLDPYLRALPTRLRTRYRLGLLDPDCAMQALVEPARSVGVEFEENAARGLVDDLRRVRTGRFGGGTELRLGTTVEPLQLQVVASRLWQRLPEGESRIDRNQVEAVGDVDEALGAYYADGAEAAARAAGVPERLLRDWIERHLVTEQRTRGQVLVGEGASADLPDVAVEALIESYLVRTEARLGATWLELSHDRLIEPVLADNAAWRDEHLSELQRRATEWDRQGRPEGLLFLGAELAAARRGSEACDPTALEAEFLARSERADQARRRQRAMERGVRWSLAVLAIVALGIAGYAVASLHRAKAAHREAVERHARLLTSEALRGMTEAPQRSLLLGAHALDLAETLEQQTGSESLRRSVEQALGSLISLIGGERLDPPSGDGMAPMAIDPTGRWAVQATDGGAAVLWDLTQEAGAVGESLSRRSEELRLGSGGIASAAFSDDGAWLALGDADGTLRIWSLSSAERVSFEAELGAGNARCLAFGHDGRGGRLLAAGGREGLTLHAVAEGLSPRPLPVPGGNPDPVTAIDFGASGGVLAFADARGRCWVASLDTDPPRVLPTPTQAGAVTALAISPDGRWLAAASKDAVVRVTDIARVRELHRAQGPPPTPTALAEAQVELDGHDGGLQCLALSPTGRHLATGAADDMVRLWTVPPSRVPPLLLHARGATVVLAFHSSGTRLLSGRPDGIVQEWTLDLQGDVPRKRRVAWRNGHELEILALGYSRDGRPVSGAGDGSLRLWDPEGPRFESTRLNEWGDMEARLVAAGHVALPGGPAVLVVPEFGRTWLHSQAGTQRRRLPPFEDDGHLNALATSPASSLVLWSDQHGHLGCADLARPDLTPRIAELALRPESAVTSLSMAPDRGLVAVGRGDGTLTLYSFDGAWSEQWSAKLDAAVTALDFDAAGQWIAAGTGAGEALLWSLPTEDSRPAGEPVRLRGRPAGAPRLATDAVRSLVVLQPREGGAVRLFAGSGEGLITDWDVDGGSPRATVDAHRGAVMAMDVSPDAAWLASGGADHSVALRLVQDITLSPIPISGPQAPVVSVSFHPVDGSLVGAARGGRAWRWTGWQSRPGRDDGDLKAVARARAGREMTAWELLTYLGEQPREQARVAEDTP
jgi:WD40 repeat protein